MNSDSNGIGYKTSFLDIVLYNIVEYCLKNFLYTEIKYHKILKTWFDTFWPALSDGTTLKLLECADSTKSYDRLGCPLLPYPKHSISDHVPNTKR
jgi:hypothetical protein